MSYLQGKEGALRAVYLVFVGTPRIQHWQNSLTYRDASPTLARFLHQVTSEQALDLSATNGREECKVNVKQLLLPVIACATLAVCSGQNAMAATSWVYNPDNGHSYEYVCTGYNPDNRLSWYDAEALAERAGGYLATITSAQENDWIWNNLGGTQLAHSWLGGYQPAGSPEPDGNWQWVTGEAWTYSNWAPGEPSDFRGNDPNGESALMLGRWGDPINWWNDLDPYTNNYGVDYANGYIVERNPSPVPEPSGLLALLGGLPVIAPFVRKFRK